MYSRDDTNAQFLLYPYPFSIIFCPFFMCFIYGTLQMALISIFLSYLYPFPTIGLNSYLNLFPPLLRNKQIMLISNLLYSLFPLNDRLKILIKSILFNFFILNLIYILDNASRLSFFLFFVTIKFTQERGIKSQPVSH